MSFTDNNSCRDGKSAEKIIIDRQSYKGVEKGLELTKAPIEIRKARNRMN